MVENSETSVPKGKRSTRKTRERTIEEGLQIIEDSVLAYQDSGGSMTIIPELYHKGRRAVVILIFDAQVQDNHIVPIVSVQPG